MAVSCRIALRIRSRQAQITTSEAMCGRVCWGLALIADGLYTAYECAMTVLRPAIRGYLVVLKGVRMTMELGEC